MKMKGKESHIAYLSTYPPIKCGIATFTKDLSDAMCKVSKNCVFPKIISVNTNGEVPDYGKEVILQIKSTDINDYLKASEKINDDDKIKVVSVQHEFKIFGSDHGNNLIAFMKKVRKPLITTFHCVLSAPSEKREKIVRKIYDNSDYIIVMNDLAIDILEQDYGLDKSKIVVIPHGIHDVPYLPNEKLKLDLGYKSRTILSTFGLLRPGRGERSSGKGCEYVLDALPKVIEKFPEVLYLIIGETHPKTLREEGEKYRDHLKQKVKELGLENNVIFIEEYLELDELLKYLQATDIYLCISRNLGQITSGTLVYAMGCGSAIVSTPFLHARRVIDSKKGILVKPTNPDSCTNAIIKILSVPGLREKMGKKCYLDTRDLTWEKIARKHLDLFNEYL